MSSQQLRIADHSDISKISEVHRLSWPGGSATEYEPEFLERILKHRCSLEAWQKRFADPSFSAATILLAHYDDDPVGFAQLGPSDEDEAETAQIQRFYVVPTQWGKGVSQSLMEAALKHFSTAGHQEVRVWTVHPRAKRFYEKCGFAASGKERSYPLLDSEEDAVAMTTEYEYRRKI